MAAAVTDDDLERYLSGALAPSIVKRIERALSRSPQLRTRLEELRAEREIIDEVKDSFAIRLPEAEEERIVAEGLGRLGTTLGEQPLA